VNNQNNLVKVIGRVTIDDKKKESACCCTHCGIKTDSKFGNLREQVFNLTTNSMEYLCLSCNIFDKTPN
jgi:hypothetical protein